MALAGRTPTPTPILEARGSWRAKGRGGEPRFEDGLGPCPAWLSKEAKAEWRRVARQLARAGVGQRVDRALLAAYCEAWGEFRELVQLVRARGYEGGWRLVNAKNQAADRLLKASDRFGFSPAARARLKATEDSASGGDQDEEARYFRPVG